MNRILLSFWRPGFVILVAFLTLAPTFVSLGATDDFIIQQLVGGDSTPPTTPVNFTATPIATTQIDLSWDASTDNYLMGGYQVWRDDAFLATTTATSYSDVGLTASTTYTYYVYAFDSFFNYSASSSPVSTTTLQIPPPTPTTTPTTTPEDTQTGSRIPPFPNQMLTLEIIPGKDSVIIRYETKSHIRSTIRWGRTSSYELGSIAESAFGTKHETKITGLTPGVTYYLTLEGENRLGRYGVLHRDTFATLPPDDIFPPGNVRELTATTDGDDVVLSWINPRDSDFDKVRVVRSDRFYPTDTADGWPVYEGDGESFRDGGVLESDNVQYYTIFAYDELGNISSGAVIAVGPEGEDGPPVSPTENELSLTFSDVLFVQGGVVVPAHDGVVTVDGAKQLTISIPYERLPEHLKTVIVVIREGRESDRSFRFLLRVNREQSFYTGTLAPLGRSGEFPVSIAVFDYKTAQVGYADGTIRSRIESTYAIPVGFLDYVKTAGLGLWYVTLFLLLIALIGILTGRALRREA